MNKLAFKLRNFRIFLILHIFDTFYIEPQKIYRGIDFHIGWLATTLLSLS